MITVFSSWFTCYLHKKGKFTVPVNSSIFSSACPWPPSWPFSGMLVIFSASRDPKLNCQSLGLPRNRQEHSFIHACSTSSTSPFAKVILNRDKTAFAQTCPWPPSWPFSGTLIIFSASRDPKGNRQSIGLRRNRQEYSFIYACSTSCTPLLSKLLRNRDKTAFARTCPCRFPGKGKWNFWINSVSLTLCEFLWNRVFNDTYRCKIVPPSYCGSQIWKGLLAKYHISNFLLSMPATLVLKCHEHLSMNIFFSFWTDTTDVVSTNRNSQVWQKTTMYVHEAVKNGLLIVTSLCRCLTGNKERTYRNISLSLHGLFCSSNTKFVLQWV